MDKSFATWISCMLLKILSISISLSKVAVSYLFGQLFVLCTFLIMFILLVLCTLLILDNFLSPTGTKRGRHFTLYMDGDMICSWSWQFLCVLCFGYLICWSWSPFCVFVDIGHGFGLMNAYWLSLDKWSLWIYVDIYVSIHLKLGEASW